MGYSIDDKLELMSTLRYDLLDERRHWTNKLTNQRMRYVRWLRKVEPIDKQLRELELVYSEVAWYGDIITEELKGYAYIWTMK